MKEKVKTPQELAFLINYEIEAIRTTIFRQALFAEFEMQIHALAEQGQTLTPALLKDIYLKLNRTYYGPELVLDSGLEYEWARIPHFYYDFYVYQYATGLSAALALFEKAIQSKRIEGSLFAISLFGRKPLSAGSAQARRRRSERTRSHSGSYETIWKPFAELKKQLQKNEI